MKKDPIILACVVSILSGAVIAGMASGNIPVLVDCLRMGPIELKILHIAGDGQTALAYTLIPIRLRAIYRELRARPTAEQFNQFAAFIVLCGLTHMTNILRFWLPLEGPFGVLKNATGLVSLGVYLELRRQTQEILGLGHKQEELERAKAQALAEAAENARLAEAAANVARDLSVANEAIANQLAALEAKDRTIREIASPILEVAEGVIAVPIIGSIDPKRADDLEHRLCLHVMARQPRYAILDLTGVDTIDTAVAHALHRLVRMVALQGTRCVATGIRFDVARALVSLEIDLKMPTYSTLAAGMAAIGGKVQ